MTGIAHPAGNRHADVLPENHPLPAPADLNALPPAVWPRGAQRVEGSLSVGGVDVRDLAAEFGTPLYVLDEDDFRARAREYRAAFADEDVYYAGKAFLCGAVARWVAEEGLGLCVTHGYLLLFRAFHRSAARTGLGPAATLGRERQDAAQTDAGTRAFPPLS